MAASTNERAATEDEGIQRRVARRNANKRACAQGGPTQDPESIVALACECTRVDCDRSVKVPLYVYRRMLEADHYLLQAGHHAFRRYRTIISVGLMRIEERG